MSGLKVLVFESDRDFAASVTLAFRQRGCVTRVVDDGQAGLDIAQIERPDLIILAIELPRMNGFAVCNRLKKHPDLKDVPLVIVSADSPIETFEQHSKLRTRAEDYVHKPLTPDALIARCAMFVTIPAVTTGAAEVPDGQSNTTLRGPEIPKSDQTTDLELEGLSDAAFDNIIMDAPTAHPATPALLSQPDGAEEFEDFTVVSPKAMISQIARHPAPAASAMRAPSTPSAAVALQSELDRTRRRIEDLERDLAAARTAAIKVDDDARKIRERSDEAARSSRETEEPKKPSVRSPAGVSTREFLELREGLNRKDKEILQLKDAVNGRDKQILEAREALLQRDLEKNDLEEKVLQRELEATEAQESARSVAEEQLATAAAAQTQLTEALRASETARAALEAERGGLVSSLRDSEALKGSLEASLEAERRRGTEAVEALKDSHLHTQERAVAEREESISAVRESLGAEHLRALEALRDEHRSALAEQTARAEGAQSAERKSSEEVAALKVAHAEAIEALRAEHRGALSDAEARRGEQVGALEAAMAAAAAAALASIELARKEHAETIEAHDSAHDSALAELRAQSESTVRDANAAHLVERDVLSAQIAALKANSEELSRRLAEGAKQAARSVGLWAQARRAMQIAAAFSEQAEATPDTKGDEAIRS